MTAGTLVQLARSSSATIRGISRCALRWVVAYAGLGMVVTGERNTAFSMCSSMGGLWTHPAPLWMSCGVDVGYAPQGGAPKANSRPDHTFTLTAPYWSRSIPRSPAALVVVFLAVLGYTTNPSPIVPQSR